VNVVHVLLTGATRYDRLCTIIDLSSASESTPVLFEAAPGGWLRDGSASALTELSKFLRSGEVDLLHLHGAAQPPGGLVSGLPIPWVSDRRLTLPRSFFRRTRQPSAVLIDRGVPEVASDEWFDVRNQPRSSTVRRVGSFVRNEVTRNNLEQAAGRIERFRDDVEWVLFETPPTPDQMVTLDLWVDPASGEDDADGMVTEALACLTPVVAARTEINSRRLDGGRAGLLTPVGDHNELTHAVLNALFKPEVTSPHRLQMERSRDRLRPVRRQEAVQRIYQEVKV